MADDHTSEEVLLEDTKSEISVDQIEDAGTVGVERISDEVNLLDKLTIHIK